MERKEFELKAKDKVVQKMTRDGLVDENLADKTTKKARPGDPTREQETGKETNPTPEQKPRGQPKRRPTARKRQALLQEKPLVAETGQSRRETAKPGDAPKEKQKKKYAAKLRFDDQPKSSKFAPVAKPAGVGAMYMKSKLHQRTDDDNLAVTAARSGRKQTAFTAGKRRAARQPRTPPRSKEPCKNTQSKSNMQRERVRQQRRRQKQGERPRGQRRGQRAF